jgi:hypothetical protein
VYVVLVLMVAAIALGSAVGLSERVSRRFLGPIRAAGLGSGCLAVFGQLLPEAAEHMGVLALVPFALSLFGSTGVERLVLARDASLDRGAANATRASLELGVVGLAIHQLIEGVALGAWRTAHERLEPDAGGAFGAGAGVLVAIAAHTVPIVAVLTLALSAVMGPRRAVSRVVLLVAASVVGVVLSGVPSAASFFVHHEGWLHALVAGLLLHAVLHAAVSTDHGHHHPGASRFRELLTRTPELLGLAAGSAIVIAGIVVSEAPIDLRSGSMWVVLGIAVVMAIVLHRAMPHGVRSVAIGL